MPSGERKVYESRVYFSRYARVERKLLSAAFDLDLDFASCTHGPVQYRGRAAASAPRKGLKSRARLQPLRYAPKALCHPDRSRSASDGAAEGSAARIYFLTAFLAPRRDSWTNRSTSP